MMSTELVKVWCNPAKRQSGRHEIATVMSDVVNGVLYFTITYKDQVTTVSETRDFQTFASEVSRPLVDNESTTYAAYCPGCKAPVQLNSQQLQPLIVEALREHRVVEMNVSPDAAIETDRQWRTAREYMGMASESIYPAAKDRLRTDPRRQPND
jgi:hypothetical protein